MSSNGAAKPFTFTLDGQEVEARAGETIFRAARRCGIRLPHLCYTPMPGYRPDGNCRVCMVEIEGERVLAASCIRMPTSGMKVKTQSDRATAARPLGAELLLADQPPPRPPGRPIRQHKHPHHPARPPRAGGPGLPPPSPPPGTAH